ncbi:MAG: lipopolysaccharide biosynthesis protein [Pseudomonadota bacterium]
MEWIANFFNADTHSGIARRTALTAYGIRVFSAGIAYIAQIFLARWLGSHHYGVYVMVWTWVLILGHISTLGLSVIPELFIPTYTQRGENGLLRGYTFYARLMTFLSAAIVGVLGIAGVYMLGDALDSYYVWPFYLAFVCLPFFTITETLDGISRCYNAAVTAMGPPYVLRPLLIIVFMAAGHYLELIPATAPGAMIAALAACIVTAALQLAMVSRLLAKHIPKIPYRFEQKIWLLAALPLFFAEAARVLLQNVDILVLSRYVLPENLAVYFAASKTLALALFVNFAVAAAVSHRFTEYHVTGDGPRLKHFIAQASLWSFAATMLAIVLVILLGQGFLFLFGPGFTAGFPLLFIFSIGVIIRSMIGPADRLLALLGHQKLLAGIVALALLFATLLLFLLVPFYGLMGAAAAMSGAMVLETALLIFFIRRKLNLTVGFWHYNKHRLA